MLAHGKQKSILMFEGIYFFVEIEFSPSSTKKYILYIRPLPNRMVMVAHALSRTGLIPDT